SVFLLAACGGQGAEAAAAQPSRSPEAAVTRELTRIRARTDSIDAIFQPLPLLRPAEEAAMRRFDNDAQLAAARRLGISPGAGRSELDRMAADGRVTRLRDSTAHWVVRKLDSSSPYLTRDAASALEEIAQRFQGALARHRLPAYRLEVSSALRSAEDQAALRRTNVNAASGESTHQYGTTFDVAYSAFAPPAVPVIRAAIPEAPWLESHLSWVAGTLAETVAARRSRELMAILGKVLIEMQNEGKIMVTLERLQPVYHMTVARRY
ncbi:MAG TPA: DUF5715 family protein, partial [Gemmatimonadaceae bacterium]|nr:DUF5715 family protein [Gemmatimonadaceae bacterium]